MSSHPRELFLRKPSASSRRCRNEVRLHRATCPHLAGAAHVPRARGVRQRRRSRPESHRAIANRRLLQEVHQLHARHKGRYGSPRMHAALRAEGHRISRGRVERGHYFASTRMLCDLDLANMFRKSCPVTSSRPNC